MGDAEVSAPRFGRAVPISRGGAAVAAGPVVLPASAAAAAAAAATATAVAPNRGRQRERETKTSTDEENKRWSSRSRSPVREPGVTPQRRRIDRSGSPGPRQRQQQQRRESSSSPRRDRPPVPAARLEQLYNSSTPLQDEKKGERQYAPQFDENLMDEQQFEDALGDDAPQAVNDADIAEASRSMAAAGGGRGGSDDKDDNPDGRRGGRGSNRIVCMSDRAVPLDDIAYELSRPDKVELDKKCPRCWLAIRLGGKRHQSLVKMDNIFRDRYGRTCNPELVKIIQGIWNKKIRPHIKRNPRKRITLHKPEFPVGDIYRHYLDHACPDELADRRDRVETRLHKNKLTGYMWSKNAADEGARETPNEKNNKMFFSCQASLRAGKRT